jgi:hypothetical protein
MGLRAAAREGWLLPVSAVVSLLRSLTTVPALAVGLALVAKGAGQGARLAPFSPLAPLEGAAAVLSSHRFLFIVGGLWGAGVLLSGALRILFLAGALPTLGARLAGVDPTRRFAPGVLWGFPRQVGTWLLATVLELGAAGYLVAVAVAAGRLVGPPKGGLHSLLLATSGALAIAVGLAGLLGSRVLGDAAAARAAILAESPAVAFAGAVGRLLARPGAFLLGGIWAAFAAAAASALLQPASALLAGVAGQVDGLVMLGPQAMLALLGVAGAAAVDLAWLATVGVLACGELPSRAPGP